MKNSKLLNAAFVALLALGLTSCSSIDIVKRQYTNGFYVHVNKKAAPVKTEQAKEKTESDDLLINKPHNNLFADISNNSFHVSEANNISAPLTETSLFEMSPVSISNRSSALTQKSQKQLHANRFDKKIIKLEKKLQKVDFRQTKGDAPTLVLILLCLFLPFIAVGIVDDWGTRFLISIILTLLFWLPGVIYAFIVCFASA